MIDRHSLSEPRICPTATEDDLSWEVDVFRENVPDPIDMLRIDDTTLPPRTRKGKVVWRLPTEYGKVPSFGTDERRRIMDLFKERKKNRRKKKQCSASSVSSVVLSRSQSSLFSDEEDLPKEAKPPRKKNTPGVVVPETVSTTTKGHPIKHLKKQLSSEIRIEKEDSDHEDMDQPVTLHTKHKPGGPHHDARTPPTTCVPPQDLDPPGSSVETATEEQPLTTTTRPELATRRFLVVPFQEDSVTPTTAAAKAFISLYYPSVTHGLTLDLCSYYHLKAQKSISVGGAHSVVIGLDNIAMQVTSLAGCLFNVRGVVAQDAAQGGAHLLITGVCTPKGGFVTAFAHSVGLARVAEETEEDCKFVIQNDALSLLSGEMTLAVEQQKQQQQEQQLQEQQQQQQLHASRFGIPQQNNSRDQASSYPEHPHQTLLRPPGLFG